MTEVVAPSPNGLQWPNAYKHDDPAHIERFKIGKHQLDWRVCNIMRPRQGFTFRNWMFLERVDPDRKASLLIGPNLYPDLTTPLTSACIYVSMQILNQAESRHLVYENQPDSVVDFRGMVQGIAQLYDVDPSEMMSQYAHIRGFLNHTNYEPPASIDAIINEKRMQDNVEVRH